MEKRTGKHTFPWIWGKYRHPEWWDKLKRDAEKEGLNIHEYICKLADDARKEAGK